MSSTKAPKPKINTPRGIAIWPRVNEPDRRFNAGGDYKITLRLKKADEDTAALLERLEGIYTDHVTEATAQIEREFKKSGKKGKPEIKVQPRPWKDVANDEGEPTGEVDIRFGLKHTIEPKNGTPYTQTVKLYDAHLKPVDPKKWRVGGGSEVKVAGKAHTWVSPLGIGLSLWLAAVQILALVAPGGNGADFGFGEDDDGFSALEPDGAEGGGDGAGEGEAPAAGTEAGRHF